MHKNLFSTLYWNCFLNNYNSDLPCRWHPFNLQKCEVICAFSISCVLSGSSTSIRTALQCPVITCLIYTFSFFFFSLSNALDIIELSCSKRGCQAQWSVCCRELSRSSGTSLDHLVNKVSIGLASSSDLLKLNFSRMDLPKVRVVKESLFTKPTSRSAVGVCLDYVSDTLLHCRVTMRAG